MSDETCDTCEGRGYYEARREAGTFYACPDCELGDAYSDEEERERRQADV